VIAVVLVSTSAAAALGFKLGATATSVDAAAIVKAGAPAAPAPATELGLRKFSFDAAPDGVEVFVDDRAMQLDAGRVEFEGAAGTTRQVRIRYRGVEQEHVIALTSDGAVPSRLEAVVPTALPESSRDTRRLARPPENVQTGRARKGLPVSVAETASKDLEFDLREFQ